jgi:hypothetical protein
MTTTVGKSTKTRATSVSINKPPKVNNRPIGEKSPNLVTLFLGDLKEPLATKIV